MNEASPIKVLEERLRTVEDRLTAACQRSGRRRADATLVAVTKSISVETAALLPHLHAACGLAPALIHLGENRPQELWKKAAALPAGIHWHMIGHLQRNKIERTLPLVHLIHAVDSARLLVALEQEAARQGRTVPVLLEVNTSGEASKQGFAPVEVPRLADAIGPLQQVHVLGLMTMAALQDAEACRPSFALLRTLRDTLKSALSAPHTMDQLSMGMSNDFEVAVEEGATLVRLGTVLFEGLP